MLTQDQVIEYIESLKLQESSLEYTVVSKLALLGADLFTEAVTALADGNAKFSEMMALPDINAATVKIYLGAIDPGRIQYKVSVMKERMTMEPQYGPGSYGFQSFRTDNFASFQEYISGRMIGRESLMVDVVTNPKYGKSYVAAETAVRAHLNEFFVGFTTTSTDGSTIFVPGAGASMVSGMNAAYDAVRTVLPAAQHVHEMAMSVVTEPVFMVRPYADNSPLETGGILGCTMRRLHRMRMCPPSVVNYIMNHILIMEAQSINSVDDGCTFGITALKNYAALNYDIDVKDFLNSFHSYYASRLYLPSYYVATVFNNGLYTANEIGAEQDKFNLVQVYLDCVKTVADAALNQTLMAS